MKILLLISALFLVGCAGEGASSMANAKMPFEGGIEGDPAQCRQEVNRTTCQKDGSLCVNECGMKIITLNCFTIPGRIVAWDLNDANAIIDMPVEWCDSLNGQQNPLSTFLLNGGTI